MSFKIGGVEVTHLTCDSRDVRAGSCFFALSGSKTDGAMYVLNAVARGAVVIVAQVKTELPDLTVPILYVQNVRETMALASKRFYNDVCDKMNIIGVTGTNGKTTCTYYIRHLLGGKKIGVIGTLGAFVGDKRIESALTTPDPIQLHAIFNTMYQMGVRTVVMEVSAHAIHHQKIAGITFRVGVFTNLTQDHLDFFGTMQKYAKTKVEFMISPAVKTAVVNVDDRYGSVIADKRPECYKFASDKNFNVTNANASRLVAVEMNVPDRKITKRLKNLPMVDGRFNIFKSKRGFSVVVDYAHTPDGLEKILTAGRELVCDESGRLICVFGCGGDRDTLKRPIMGKISARLADYTFITSDNPRSEAPESIAMQIEEGIKTVEDAGYAIVLDRKNATECAIKMAKRGDVIILAGKGAETTQEIDGKLYAYSDIEIVKQYIKENK